MPAGFNYSADASKHKIAAHTIGLDELSALAARSDVEKYMIRWPSRRTKSQLRKASPFRFAWGSSTQTSSQRIPRINRILKNPLPFRDGKKLVYPSPRV